MATWTIKSDGPWPLCTVRASWTRRIWTVMAAPRRSGTSSKVTTQRAPEAGQSQGQGPRLGLQPECQGRLPSSGEEEDDRGRGRRASSSRGSEGERVGRVGRELGLTLSSGPWCGRVSGRATSHTRPFKGTRGLGRVGAPCSIKPSPRLTRDTPSLQGRGSRPPECWTWTQHAWELPSGAQSNDVAGTGDTAPALGAPFPAQPPPISPHPA